MANRRQMLAAVGTAGFGAVAGCLTTVPGVESGYPHRKSVSVFWEYRGRRHEGTVLNLIADEDVRVTGLVAREFEHIADDLGAVRVDAETHETLVEHFDDVRYSVGYCSREEGDRRCRNPQGSRRGFNAVQFGHRATVAYRHPRAYVIEVDDGARGEPTASDTHLERFSLTRRYDDRAIPYG